MNRTITILEKSRCTGCGACDNVCPVDAIFMKENRDGFLYPIVDTNKCINCGLCAKKCPVLNPVYINKKTPECRAVWAKDEIRLKAASGGVYSAFAQIILKKGGVICGAAYNDDLTVSLIIAEDESGLQKIRSSKYVQSSVGHTYREIEKYLTTGREVLFGACPCQVAGLNAYLGGKKFENLYTMDLICHGTPSSKVLYKYIRDTYGEGEVAIIDFRAKEVFGWATGITATLQDGTIIRKKHEQDSFYRAFLPCMSLRESCASCPFSCLPRQGDLTIGDFWGISRYSKRLDDKKGTSVVLVNNKKGEMILSACESLWSINEKVPIEQALVINKTIVQPFPANSSRKRFFNNLDKVEFNKLVNECLVHHYDVGIAGLWYGLNYGSVLTYFALYKTISDLGYQCLMLNKPKELWTDRYTDKNTIANRFIYQYCEVANVNPNKEDQFRLNKHCDTFVVGSDVVWNYAICGREAGHYFYLDFADASKKKIAYAASFGNYSRGGQEFECLARYYLKRFDAVSVRESAAVSYMRGQYGIEAEQVLDPVFLCDKNYYLQAINDSLEDVGTGYIATYFLGPDFVKKNAILALSGGLKLQYKNLSNPNRSIEYLQDRLGLELLRDVSVNDWLKYIYNCDLYIGDSFHGLCFAIILHKPFIVMIDKNLDSRGRFDTLLQITGLQNRMVYLDANKDELCSLAKMPIDYDAVESRLKRYKEKSLQWLKNALSADKVLGGQIVSGGEMRENVSLYDIFMYKIAERDSEIERLNAMMRLLLKDKNILPFTFTVNEFLNALLNSQKNCIYIVAVKDTPGLNVTPELAKQLQQSLGIRQDMFQKHWKSYLAVVDGGNCLYEELSDDKIEKEMTVGGHNLQLASAALKVGNIAKIVVDGVDHALNRRGFNIVAIDKQERTVCDSACLDLHPKLYTLLHKDLF